MPNRPPRNRRRARRREASKAVPAIMDIVLRTPSGTFSFTPSDVDNARRQLQRASTKWSYVVRNRKRWSGLPVSAKNQADRARDLLISLGLDEHAIDTIAADRLVQVEVPFVEEDDGWEARILPWEFVLAAATVDARHGQSLTVTRRLKVRGRKPPVPRRPQKVLYVESAAGPLGRLYSFDTEREGVRASLRAKTWKELRTPTLEALRATVNDFRPDIIHLAGFDSHQGLRLLQPIVNPQHAGDAAPPRTERESGATADGYLLAYPDGSPLPVDAETLGAALCANGHRPVLVSFNVHNSAARVAAMAVAAGAHAAIGFQDAFDDDLAELFYSSFYRAWRRRKWDLANSFRDAWDVVRRQPSSLIGSGLVLWCDRPLVKTGRAGRGVAAVRAAAETTESWVPGRVAGDEASQVLTSRVKPLDELNYSLLHNRCPVFDQFTLVNKSADYRNRDLLARLEDVDITVTLSAGAESATYQKRIALEAPSLDLKNAIHLPLTSELLRSVNESINSSLFVEVSWGRVIYRDSHPVRLLPVDQWRDNDRDGQWLPSFILPRDPAVTELIDKARRYVRVLRDDPSAGFDGYQSVAPRRKEPSKDIDRQVQAIWSTILHELDLGYINPPPSYNTVMDAQRLRTPSTIVRDGSGTCLDLALLLAACFELVDIYPVIFLLQDHAFPGYWRQDRFQRQFIELADGFVAEAPIEDKRTTATPGAQRVPWWFRDTAYTEILRQIRQGRLVALESVSLTAHTGFVDARKQGRANLEDRQRFHSMLDIARAREAGVTPLPFGRGTASVGSL